VFRVFESLYQYDDAPLNATVESVDDSLPYWKMERISFAAAYPDE
jgi:hypothetical protein